MTFKQEYGKGFIRPTVAGRIGSALPGRASQNMASFLVSEGPILSVEELKLAFSSNDWKKMTDAANELGKRAASLDDAEALGFVVVFCENERMRSVAMSRLAADIGVVGDPRVLEGIALNSDDEAERRSAIRALAQGAADEACSFTLAYVAIRCRHESTRIAAVNCLEMRHDELRLVSMHSEYASTREYAKSKLPQEPK